MVHSPVVMVCLSIRLFIHSSLDRISEDVACGREHSNELLVSCTSWSIPTDCGVHGHLTQTFGIWLIVIASFFLVFLYVHFDEKLGGGETAFLFTQESEASLQTGNNI